jgi:hypothetical protein
MDDDVHREAVELVNNLIADAEVEQWEHAQGFVTITTNDETKQMHINGTWDDLTEAMAWAERHQTDLNSGNGPDEIPFVVTVHPLEETTK